MKAKINITSIVVAFLVFATGLIVSTLAVQAADTDFSDGITVDSTADGSDANVGDNICDDGLGNCTLRAAIQESNATAGTQTIRFNLTGTADFTNNGQDGYTIVINSSLPEITQPAIIDGFSQSGASPNTTVSPNPMDGVLLIEIDGTALGLDSITFTPCLGISSDADGTIIRGLVINSCGDHGIAVQQVSDVSIVGNYIGTDPTGLIDEGNGRDYTASVIAMGIFGQATQNLRIGSASPADRNIIAGNQGGEIYVHDEINLGISQGNIIQGNYIGVGADGVTPLPSGYTYGLGNAILFGQSFDDIVGGDGVGEGNVIGSSLEFGVSFRDGCEGQVVQGNYIGTDYTGNSALSFTFTSSLGTFEGSGHMSGGVHSAIVSNGGFTRSPNNILIGGTTAGAGNVISGSSYDDGGIIAPSGIFLHDGTYNIRVQGNNIGVGADDTTSIPNEGGGITVYEENSSNPVSEILIGGDTASAGNIIANNLGRGITISENDPQKVAILGNSIYNNQDLGIDLGGNSVTVNDPLDIDTGPNDYLNFPEFSSVTEGGGDTLIDYKADLPAGDYRIEFFSNTTADDSGNGEGEEYLGFDTITSAGSGMQEFSVTLSGITGVANLSLTATEIDPSTPSGFGATSEFGADLTPFSDLSITKQLLNPDDVAVGATLQYQITITNEGPDDLDISGYDNSTPGVNSLIIDFLPAELSYDSVISGDVSCLSLGEESASLFGPALASHSDHEVVFCSYTGSNPILAVDESVVIVMQVVVDAGSDLLFENIVFQPPNVTDPDASIISAAYTSGNDIIDEIGTSVNNIAYASFPLPEDQEIPSNNPSSEENGTNSVLIKTGAFVIVGMMLGIALVLMSSLIYKRD